MYASELTQPKRRWRKDAYDEAVFQTWYLYANTVLGLAISIFIVVAYSSSRALSWLTDHRALVTICGLLTIPVIASRIVNARVSQFRDDKNYALRFNTERDQFMKNVQFGVITICSISLPLLTAGVYKGIQYLME
jgi:hypothetical protein